jgi:flagellar biosynthetic protein FliS
MMSPTELAYRKSAAAGASGFGLLIALYDTLAGDLRRAARAERESDLATRCHELNHALLVIAYLEDRVRRGIGGELATKLTALYSAMRRNIVQAQAKRSPELLEHEMAQVLRIREVWQQIELRSLSTPELAHRAQEPVYLGAATGRARTSASWSA